MAKSDTGTKEVLVIGLHMAVKMSLNLLNLETFEIPNVL
jgi:hypothetical protein